MKMIFRKEEDSDRENIWRVNTDPFETETEANLVIILKETVELLSQAITACHVFSPGRIVT